MLTYLETLIDPERPASGAPPKRLVPFFRWAISGAWPVVGLAVIANAFVGAMEVVMALLLKVVVDLAFTASPDTVWAENWPVLLGFALFVIFMRPVISAFASAMNALTLGPNLFAMILMRINRYTLGQSITFFEDDFAGRIAQKEMQTTRAMVDVMQETINAISFAIAALLGAAAVFGTISPMLGLVILFWIAVYFFFLRFFLPRLKGRAAKRAGKRAMVTGQIVDTVTNVKTVKLFAQTAHEDEAASEAIRGFRRASFHWAHLAVFFRLGLFFIAGLLPISMLWLGIELWRDGSATPGDLAAIGALSFRLSQMTGWISWTLMGIFSNLGEIEDGIRTLTPDYVLRDADGADVLDIDKGAVNLNAVTFQYGGDIGGVRDLTLRVKPGEKLGLVGQSGAGKSTLMSLVQRLYDPEEGRVEIDGQDIAKVTQESLRAAIGTVTQEAEMFNRSARDNICYGAPDADMDAIIAATTKAEAHGFITDLEDRNGNKGYDAFLGERGVKLSGGQRQRIALARAILKDAPILLLDEATSALDSEVEAAIQSALAHVMEGKTVIAIAHRLSTIARMDRILVMDDGRIVEEGSHAELLEQGGVYAGLWERQTGGFLKFD